ncbi:T9SS type A sorting domain-containing protein [Xanthomarina sp.]|uniref:T9SS type A sorting domain-containing protein n=1 Tax=Xanthomarina sp. TaxID=1931211 RepID=UPI002B91B13D|nr:T9SS type A sorting domain-containing protein [Xanthomarina sp.]HLV38192.1 T9SS type A sorting domain-containing protein [Xanthomarina sp.]
MNVTGTNAVFEGQVNIALGFDANVGDSFTIATVSGIIATKNLTSPVYGDYGCKHYTFNVTYPTDKNVMLTISGKADIIAPDVITQNVTVQLNASGNASITASQINNGSTDNCTLPANLTLALNVTNFTCANLGDNTVTLTVMDEAGNSASANTTITVEDLIDPVISTCPGNITVVGDSETGYTIPDYFGSGEVTASDNCSVSTVVQVPAPGAVVVTGTTSVMVTVSDSSGNSAVCSFDVEVTLSIDSYELTDASILMYPNPANQNVTLKNNGNQQLKSAIIIDVKGSVIQEINLEDMGISKTISIQDYASGVYFVKIYSEFSNLVKRLIKQ